MSQRGFGSVILLVSIIVIVAVIGGAYYVGTQKNPNQIGTTSTIISNPPSSSNDKKPENSEKTFSTTGVNAGLTLKYPSNWVNPEGIFIAEKTFVAGEQDRSKIYNIIEVQKYVTQLYEGYTNAEWFNKINNLTSSDSDQKEVRTKITSGKVASGEQYVIFKDESSLTVQAGTFKQVKAYILKDQIIYQLTLDLYDANGLEVFKQIVASSVVT